jgi:hypothetical protein
MTSTWNDGCYWKRKILYMGETADFRIIQAEKNKGPDPYDSAL